MGHLFGDVVNHHRIHGNRLAGIEQSSGDGAVIGLKGDLTQPVIGSGAGGFSVEEDEHLGPFWSPIALMDNFGELTFIAY